MGQQGPASGALLLSLIHIFVNAALALIGAGVSVFLIQWLKKQTTEAQRKELTAWVKYSEGF